MESELERLLILQNRDQKIKQIRTEAKTVPLQRAQLDAQTAASAASLEAVKAKARQIEIERKNLELDAGTRAQSIARLKTQQYETRKNDEFRAIGHEIERYEKEIHDIEDKELDLMEATDKLKVEIAAEEAKASEMRDSVARQLDDLAAKTKALDAQLGALLQERAELAAQIDEDVLDRYERLFASKGDAAIVALEHEVCTGCHMKVTTQTSHRAKSGKELVSCEQCGRILYFAE